MCRLFRLLNCFPCLTCQSLKLPTALHVTSSCWWLTQTALNCFKAPIWIWIWQGICHSKIKCFRSPSFTINWQGLMQQHGKWMQMLGVLGLIWNVISFMMTIYDTVLENDVTWYARTIWLLFISELMPECLVECKVHNWTSKYWKMFV